MLIYYLFINFTIVHQLYQDNNYYFVFTSDGFCVKDTKTRTMLFHNKSENGPYPIHLHCQFKNKSLSPVTFVGERVAPPVWHQHLGYPAFLILQHMASVQSLPFHCSLQYHDLCLSRSLGKSTWLPYQLSSFISTSPLEFMHSDIWTWPHYSIKGYKYYILFMNDFSKCCWIYLMIFKHVAYDCFVKFKTHVENFPACKLSPFSQMMEERILELNINVFFLNMVFS